MRKMVATVLITAAILAAVAGAVYGAAAVLGVAPDRFGAGSVAVTDLDCETGSGLVSETVTCTSS